MDYDKKSIIDKACTDTINKYGSEQCVFAILSFITKEDENIMFPLQEKILERK